MDVEKRVSEEEKLAHENVRYATEISPRLFPLGTDLDLKNVVKYVQLLGVGQGRYLPWCRV